MGIAPRLPCRNGWAVGVQIHAGTTPVVDQVFGERQVGALEEPRPADAVDPVGEALPGTRVLL